MSSTFDNVCILDQTLLFKTSGNIFSFLYDMGPLIGVSVEADGSDKILPLRWCLYLGYHTAGIDTYMWCDPHYLSVYMKNSIHTSLFSAGAFYVILQV